MIEAAIDNALAGIVAREEGLKGGLCITVLMPELELPNPGMAGPALVEIVQVVRITENPLFNMGADGTQITAEDAAIKTLQMLHHFSPNGANAFMGDRKAIRPANTRAPVAYDVTVRMPLGLDVPAAVAAPVITRDGDTVTITCATEGADIYFSIDGSFPYSTASYDGPQDVSSLLAGTLLRAAAYKDGLLGSSVRQLVL